MLPHIDVYMVGTVAMVRGCLVADTIDSSSDANALAIALTGGSLLTNAGIAQAIYAQGNKSADIVTVLANSFVAQTVATNSFFDFDLGDSAYYAVNVQFTPTVPNAADITIVSVSIQWWLDAAKTIPITYTNHFVFQQSNTATGIMGNNPSYGIQGKAPSRYFTLGLINNGATSASNTYYQVFSHTGTLSEKIRRNPHIGSSAIVAYKGYDLFTINGAIPAGLQYIDRPAFRNGAARLFVRLGTAIPAGVSADITIDTPTTGRIANLVFGPGTPANTVLETTTFMPSSELITINTYNGTAIPLQFWIALTQDWAA